MIPDSAVNVPPTVTLSTARRGSTLVQGGASHRGGSGTNTAASLPVQDQVSDPELAPLQQMKLRSVAGCGPGDNRGKATFLPLSQGLEPPHSTVPSLVLSPSPQRWPLGSVSLLQTSGLAIPCFFPS